MCVSLPFKRFGSFGHLQVTQHLVLLVHLSACQSLKIFFFYESFTYIRVIQISFQMILDQANGWS